MNNKQTEHQEILDIPDILEKNSAKKIFEKVIKIKEKDYVEFIMVDSKKVINNIFHMVCPIHGKYCLTGEQIRRLNLNKDYACPNCNNNYNKFKNRIEKFEVLSNKERFEYMLEQFPDLDWSDFEAIDFKNIDHTIRPACNEHGEFITTSRKLLNGDSCKWCDGIKEDLDSGEYIIPKSREYFLREKLSFYYPEEINKQIVFQKPNSFLIMDKNSISKILKPNIEKGNKEYINYLKEVRNPENWNSIFFKLNIIDKSSKFRFSLVYYIELNETWINWYKNKIIEFDDSDDAQKETTNKIIESWTNLIFGSNFQYEIIWSFWSTNLRTKLNFGWYKEKNQDKELLLPETLNSKLKIDLSSLHIPCYWSETKWDTTSNNISMIRESIGRKTTICPICKNNIEKPVIDHEHKKKVRGTGRIRDAICSNCNVFIAKAENNCKRYGINLEELPEVLKNVSEYFTTQQYNMIHYTEKDSRPLLNKNLSNKVLKYWACIFPKKKKLKYPKSGILTKDWEDAIKAYEDYIKTPAKSFSKNEYKQLLKKIDGYNANISILNISLPKTKKKNPLLIPEYPKLKVVTPEIQKIMDIINNHKG